MAGSRSLLDYLDAPVVVGDPDGRAVYVNPAFERAFSVTREQWRGRALAEFFEGGGREALLRAVAELCANSSTRRFRLRERGKGYAAVASAIDSEQGRVGVVILLNEELEGDDRSHAFHRDIQEPLQELGVCLDALVKSGGAIESVERRFIDAATRALGQIRDKHDHLRELLAGNG
jgi:PAS domain S-box-containing protein